MSSPPPVLLNFPLSTILALDNFLYFPLDLKEIQLMLKDKFEFFGYLKVLNWNGSIGFKAAENFVFTDHFNRTHFHSEYF